MIKTYFEVINKGKSFVKLALFFVFSFKLKYIFIVSIIYVDIKYFYNIYDITYLYINTYIFINMLFYSYKKSPFYLT